MDDFMAQQRDWEDRSSKAQAAAAQAYSRLVLLAEQQNGGQAHVAAVFVASTYNSKCCHFDLFDLRAVDVAISDDMLVCLDALRWGREDLHALIPDGDRRIQRLCAIRGLLAADADTDTDAEET